MDKKELEKIMNGKKALQAIMKEGYQIDVTEEELILALRELRNVAARNTNSEEHSKNGFNIQKFNIFQFKYSLSDKQRVKSDLEVAKVYSAAPTTINQIELDGLRELYNVILRLRRMKAEEYTGMNGIKVARTNK